MSKKAIKMLDEYKSKLDMIVFEYEKGFSDFSKSQKNAMEEMKRFENMISSMYHFNLLSEKDYMEFTNVPFKLECEVVDKILYMNV